MTDTPADGDRPDIIAMPPALFAAALVAAILLEWLLPLHLLPPPGHPAALVAGLVLIAVPMALAVWALREMRAAKTHVNPRRPTLHVVETGPYAISRNPIYLGMVLPLLGLGLLFSLDWSLLLAPLLWAGLHFGVVLREEVYLAAKFGTPYRDYLARTRRWL